jgi:uncharacterized DUF497 family protein
VKDGCEFDWDDHNAGHLAKHDISRFEAEDVLTGNHILLEYQMEGNEQRWVAVGATRTGSHFEYCVCRATRSDSPNHWLDR